VPQMNPFTQALPTADRRLPTAHCRLPTAHCPLPTDNNKENRKEWETFSG
jgi:hypothetical protein